MADFNYQSGAMRWWCDMAQSKPHLEIFLFRQMS